MNNDHCEKTITVTATASDSFPADHVTVSVTAAGEGKRYADAVKSAEELADKTVGAVKVAGFTVHAGTVNVSALREGKSIRGYRASRKFGFEFDYDKEKMGAALGLLSECPCDWRISYSLKDKSASKTLLTRAVKAARDDAETIAAAAGVKLGALCNVEYSGGSSRPVALCAAVFDAGAAATAEPDDISLSETVTCSWYI